jgi:redox-regulated HSP33 family molecular chaperone
MMKEQETTEVRCEFCRQSYPFSRDELTRLMNPGNGS